MLVQKELALASMTSKQRRIQERDEDDERREARSKLFVSETETMRKAQQSYGDVGARLKSMQGIIEKQKAMQARIANKKKKS